jgi:hypothetical protein
LSIVHLVPDIEELLLLDPVASWRNQSCKKHSKINCETLCKWLHLVFLLNEREDKVHRCCVDEEL